MTDDDKIELKFLESILVDYGGDITLLTKDRRQRLTYLRAKARHPHQTQTKENNA